MNIYSKSNTPDGFYVYAYMRENNTPYYIGKGSGLRAWNPNHTINLPKDKSRIIVLEQRLTEIGAFALERRMIKWYGRVDLCTGILHNKTDGGEGVSGKIVSQPTRDKIRKKLIGKKTGPRTQETKSKISEKLSGIIRGPMSETQKEKLSLLHLGKTHSEQSKLKRSLSLIGHHQTRIICPHCNQTGGISLMKRYHLDNCKFR
jgi:hypothetical protein